VSHLCFLNGTAILPDRLLPDAVIVCRDERITYVGTARSRVPASAKIIDAKGGYISPGFVDIHIHGGGGADVMDGSLDAVRTVSQSHARHGTTTMFPTTSTGTDNQIHAMLAACSEVRDTWNIQSGSKIAGVHLYGPYFAKGKTGCHDESVCRAPEATEYRRYFESGIVGIATCAAELPGAAAFYRHANKRGCLVTCGHSNSSWDEMEAAFKNGMRHVDHFWCAMSNVSSVRKRLGVPMQGSMLEYVLANPEMSTEVIADGMHLAPELLSFAWRMKGSERLCLVTDCNRALDMPPGKYRFGPEADGSWFTSDGQVGWASPGSLASSVMGMDHMVRTMHKVGNVPLQDAVRMASLTPAERTGIDQQIGSLTAGKQADIVLLSKTLKVKQVHINGERLQIMLRK
tara:strand:+ start:24081 stop:25286 length:1206 start_codon:yes stop_codon:yes gene_type:complete